MAANPTRESTNSGGDHQPRSVVVPDRMIHRRVAVSSIVNIAPEVTPVVSRQPEPEIIETKAVAAPPAAPVVRHSPVHSAKLHAKPTSVRTVQQAQAEPLESTQVERAASTVSVADEMQRLLARRQHVTNKLARTAGRLQLLTQAIESERIGERELSGAATPPKVTQITQKVRAAGWRRHVLHTAAIALVAVGGYMGVSAWSSDHTVEAKYEDAPILSSTTAPEAAEQSAEGRDESAVSKMDLALHTASKQSPRALYIESLDIAARIQPMGTNAEGGMQAPQNIFDAGWYSESSIPSKAGALVINGHASGPTKLGIFAYIDTLEAGDKVVVETGDGTRFTYEVAAVETVDRNNVNVDKLMQPYGGDNQGLNLISCSGQWLKTEQTYNNRTIVYAKLIQ